MMVDKSFLKPLLGNKNKIKINKNKPKTKIDKSNLAMPTTKDIVDKDFMNWLHNNKPCVICGVSPIEVHHINGRARGRNDREIVPLCPKHHRGEFSPHGRDVKEFYEEIGKDELLALADRFYKEFKSEKGSVK